MSPASKPPPRLEANPPGDQGFLADAKARPCPHVNLSVTLPDIPETASTLGMLERIAQQVHPAHDIAQAQKIRFITGHLAANAPLTVTCHLQLPHGSSCEVFGASDQKNEYVAVELKSMLFYLENRARRFTIGSTLRWIMRNLEDLAGFVMLIAVEEVDAYEEDEDYAYGAGWLEYVTAMWEGKTMTEGGWICEGGLDG